MSQQWTPGTGTGNPLPVPTSIGLIRVRAMTVEVVPTGFPREFDGVTKYYRSMVTVTSYAGMVRDNTAPTPDTTYSVTPRTITETVDRGWNVATTINGSTDFDDDAAPTYDEDPAVWTPALVGSPTWDAPDDPVDTATTSTVVRQANGIWSGTETTVVTWSDEITQEDLAGALAAARDAAVFDSSTYSLGAAISPAPDYTSDPFDGSKRLVVVEYSMGTYSGRAFISAVELLRRTVGSAAVFEETPFTVALADPVTISGDHGQDSFRGDDLMLFSGWRRIDLFDRYPDEPAEFTGTASAWVVPLSGHNYVTSTTGTITNDSGAAYLGGVSAAPVTGEPAQFFHSVGEVSP